MSPSAARRPPRDTADRPQSKPAHRIARPRLTLSEIVRELQAELARARLEQPSVRLWDNSKHAVQIEVKVYAGSQPDVLTARDAALEAARIYDQLRSLYPYPDNGAQAPEESKP